MMSSHKNHIPGIVLAAALVVTAHPPTALGQSSNGVKHQQAESELQKIKEQLEEKAENLGDLTEKEEHAQAKSRALREEMELLEEVKTRLRKKHRRLNKQYSTTEQLVHEFEEQHALRQEVLARTLATLYTSPALADPPGLSDGGSPVKRRRYFARLVSQAQADRVLQAEDSLAAWDKRRADLDDSRTRVQVATTQKEKEKLKKERLLAKSEREAFGYRQRREQELDEIEQIQREALILAELIDRLATLPGVQDAVDYDFPGWKGRLHWPLAGEVKSTVGNRINPKYKTETIETGIFISGKPGEPVVNAADGEIAYAGRRRGLGNVVVVGHGSGYFSVYAHLGEISVITGRVVRAGDQIGTAGESHPRFGSGVIFELRNSKEILDPLEWLK